MTVRLTSAMLVSSLTRRVSQEGGNAVILARGDPDAGAVLLFCMERGMFTSLQERILNVDGDYDWQAVGPTKADSAADADAYMSRRRLRDPDMWLVELDIANAERFAAETIGLG